MGSPKSPLDFFGERRSSGVSEFCRLRRNEGYGACDDEASSAFLLPAGPERKNTR